MAIKIVKITSRPKPHFDLYIGRANKWFELEGSKWGNPFVMKKESERLARCDQYREHVLNSPELMAALHELRDQTLGCYCHNDEPGHKRCHGDELRDLYHEFVVIKSPEEFISLRDNNDIRATRDEALLHVWESLIEHHPDYKRWVIHNKTVPVEILHRLAKDVDCEIRYCVATKRKCSFEIFDLLAHDPEESIREQLLFNAKVPVDILKKLAKDPSGQIAERANRLLLSLEKQ